MTIDVMQILYVSMHDYIWITYLHTTELEMDAMLVGLAIDGAAARRAYVVASG
jgi:hypothetical protein